MLGNRAGLGLVHEVGDGGLIAVGLLVWALGIAGLLHGNEIAGALAAVATVTLGMLLMARFFDNRQ